jgi:histidinol-phosphate aminotransferase
VSKPSAPPGSADLGPLADRVPEVLRGTSAYHVPKPLELRAKLDANEFPYALPDELRARLADELARVPLERYPDSRASELRTLVAAHDHVAPAQLVFGNGSDELIAMLIAAFAGPVVFPSPTFVYYKLAATARGVPAVEVPLRADFTLDEAALERAVATHRPGVVFLALPNNPTGTLWDPDVACRLAAAHRDVVIVSDEAYFAYSGRTNLAHLPAHPNLVVMRTLSKLGLAGLRVGYTIASPAIAAVLEKVRPPYNLSALDQRAAALMLEHGMTWWRDKIGEVVRERARVAAALAALGFDVFASEANLVLVRRAGAGRLWQQLSERGISVRNFDQPGPLAGCLRITIGTPDENALLVAALTELCAG